MEHAERDEAIYEPEAGWLVLPRLPKALMSHDRVSKDSLPVKLTRYRNDYRNTSSVSDRPSLVPSESRTLPLIPYMVPLVPLVSEIFCTDELCTLYQPALCDVTIGKDGLSRILQRLLCHCGVEISREGSGETTTAASWMLCSGELLAQVIRDVQRNYLPESPEPDSNTLETDTDVLAMEYDLNDVTGESGKALRAKELKSFILQSNAYASLPSTLLCFLQAPYEERLLVALSQSAKSEKGLPLEPAYLESAVGELSWVPASRLHISVQDKRSGLDKPKAWIERLTNEKWQWWPLGPCNIPIPHGCNRLAWTTPSGHEQYLDYDSAHEEQLRVVVSTAPGFLELPAGTSPSTTPAYGNSQGQTGDGSTSVPAAIHAQSGTSLRYSGRFLPQRPPMPPLPTRSGSIRPRPGSTTGTVYLCVQNGDDYSFPCIAIQPQTTDRECFDQLRKHYVCVRGMLRQLFSIWRFDHCEFYQFQKYALGTGEPAEVGFPSEKDDFYEFRKPVSPSPPLGPIAEGEFRDYFYKHCQPCNFLQRSWKRQIRHRFLDRRAYSSAIEVLPKRILEMHFNNGRREAFWGLYAVERISFAWVAVYGILANLPSLVYFFLWLFYWRHGSDVQGAAVPVSLSLTLTAMWIGLILASKK